MKKVTFLQRSTESIGKHYPAILFGLIIMIYIVIRSIHVSLGFDEVVSFQLMERDDWFHFWEHSNNHFLNTILMKASTWLFGNSEWAIRLPNLLAGLLYLVVSYRIALHVSRKHAFWIMVLLISSPFLLDFFSLARGYGLGLSLVMLSLYLVMKFVDSPGFKAGVMVLIAGFLAVSSNLSFTYFFLGLGAVLLLLCVLRKKWINFLIYLIFILSAITAILYLVSSLTELKHMYYGGKRNFINDSIASLGRCLAYGISHEMIFRLILDTGFLAAILFAIYRVYKLFTGFTLTKVDLPPLIFTIMVAIPIILHEFFGALLPVERAMISFYPLMMISCVVILISLINNRWIIRIMASAWLVFTLYSLNVSSSYTFRFDSGSKKVMQYLQNQHDSHQKNLSIGVHRLYDPSAHYYFMIYKQNRWLSIHTYGSTWDYKLDIEELRPEYYRRKSNQKTLLDTTEARLITESGHDYYYFPEFYFNEIKRQGYKVVVVETYPDAGSLLFRLNVEE